MILGITISGNRSYIQPTLTAIPTGLHVIPGITTRKIEATSRYIYIYICIYLYYEQGASCRRTCLGLSCHLMLVLYYLKGVCRVQSINLRLLRDRAPMRTLLSAELSINPRARRDGETQEHTPGAPRPALCLEPNDTFIQLDV